MVRRARDTDARELERQADCLESECISHRQSAPEFVGKMADISYFQNEELEDSGDGNSKEDMLDCTDDLLSRDSEPQLTPLDRLFQRAISDKPAERQMVGKLLINIFQNAIKLKLRIKPDEFFQPVEHIINDSESSVRSSLVESLARVALLCQESPYLFGESLTNRILSVILIYLRDQDNQVRQDAQSALRMLLDRDLLTEEQIDNVCSVILELSRDECQEFQTLALTLMTKVNPYIGDELTEKLFLDRFLELCSSKGFFVRRVCASIMGEFCTIMSKETIYNKLLQTYANLCLDNIWGVRKTSVDVMMSVARCVPLSIRRHLLSQLLVRHLRDESRWVRRSAYEILGPFISTFAKQFHELIWDQKGELVIVHENERGWPRFNVVPVAKVSDILTENLTNIFSLPDDFYWSSNERLNKSDSSNFKRKFVSRRMKKFLDLENKTDEEESDLTPAEMILKELACEVKMKHKEIQKFNTFQYYYDPPDMDLDPELVNSIINDNKTENEKSMIFNIKKEDTVPYEQRESATISKTEDDLNSEQQSDTNDNVEEKVQQQNVDERNEEESSDTDINNQQQDSNDNDRDLQGNDKLNIDQYIKFKQMLGVEKGQQQEDINDNNEVEVRLRDREEQEGINRGEDDEDDNEDEEEKSKCVQKSFKNNSISKYGPNVVDISNLTYNFNDTVDVNNISLDQGSPSNVSISSLTHLNESEDDADEIVPRILVDHFVSMADSQLATNEIGPDLDYHCAFSFPAVVLTLGKDNWHRLKDAYQRLASAVAWKVRSTLASSIHEIAIIIEKEYAARDLVPIFNGFIKDLDEVRIGALKHFATFLKVLSPQDRLQYLPKLNDFLATDSKWNWRLREELVKQLSEIIHLYQRIDVAQYIAPLLLHLMQDRIAAVRLEAIDCVAKTIAYLACHNDDALAIAMIQEMRDMLKTHAAERWIIRQTYALVCSKIVGRRRIIKGDVFARELLPYLLELSSDKVPNVRLVVARTLATDVVWINDFPDPELMNEVQQKLKEMQSDNDRDVRIFASNRENYVYMSMDKFVELQNRRRQEDDDSINQR